MALEGEMVDAAPIAAERRMIMPKNVVCKKCNNLVNDWCEKVIDSPDQDMQRDCQYFCEKTNADRIREMSDYELAQMLATGKGTFTCLKCLEFIDGECSMKCYEQCLEWLQQPAKGE